MSSSIETALSFDSIVSSREIIVFFMHLFGSTISKLSLRSSDFEDLFLIIGASVSTYF